MSEPTGSEGVEAGSQEGAKPAPSATEGKAHLWDSERAREMALKGAEVRRQRSRQRAEAAAQLGLTVRQRIAMVIAEASPAEDLRALASGLLAEALRAPGSPSSSRALRDYLEMNREALGRTTPQPDEAPETEDTDWTQLTPAQKAIHRAAWRQEHGIPSSSTSDPRDQEGESETEAAAE